MDPAEVMRKEAGKRSVDWGGYGCSCPSRIAVGRYS